MTTNRPKFQVVSGLLALAIGAVVLPLSGPTGTPRGADGEIRAAGDGEREEVGEGEASLPRALGPHLGRLKRANPGNGGESREGPRAAAEERFMALAYPDTDIPLDRLDRARSAFARVRDKGFRRRRGEVWVSVGPTEALYPFSEFHTSALYVPNEYVAGGRATALAIEGQERRPSSTVTGRSDGDRLRLTIAPADAAGAGTFTLTRNGRAILPDCLHRSCARLVPRGSSQAWCSVLAPGSGPGASATACPTSSPAFSTSPPRPSTLTARWTWRV